MVTASAVAEDLFKGIFKKDAKEKTVLTVSRVTVVVVAILAYVIALNPNSSVMGLVSNAWAGFGSAFGPIILLSLYWKRVNLPGALAGIVSGAATVLIWDYLPLFEGGVTLGSKTGLYSLALGFVISMAFIIIVSLLTKKPSDDILEEFDKMKNMSEE